MTRKSKPDEQAESAQRGLGEVITEIRALLDPLRTASGDGRHQVYAKCIPLLSEVNTLNKPPFPVRKVKALMLETSWHMRSLAGLATTSSKDEEHAAWALASLEGLAICAESGGSAH